MNDPRTDGPARVPSYGHRYGALHDQVLGDETPDTTFYSKISNKAKVDYIINALRLDPMAFHLDLPLPIDDWAMSDDMSMLNAGLYLCDLRRQFFGKLMNMKPDLRQSRVWTEHGTAEYWNVEFNALIAKRQSGTLHRDPRVLN